MSHVHDPPYTTDKTEEDEEDNEEQSVTSNDNDDSSYEDQEDTLPIQHSAMNIMFPFAVFNTME
eukprot:12151685-Ditylum_brightwellii.AAC.1